MFRSRRLRLRSPPSERETGVPAHLQDLAGRARAYVEAASSANTRRAHASDWKQFAAWCRRQNLSPLPADPQVVGLYITTCASGTPAGGKPMSVSTIERRLSSLCWNYAQRGGEKRDRRDRAIVTVLAGIRNRHAAPPRQKEAILPEDLIAMLKRSTGQSAGPARSGHAADRLCRRSTALRNHRPRSRAGPDGGRARLD